MRLFANQVLTENGNPWYAPNLLLQKFSAPKFSATTCLTFHPQKENEKAGLIIMGEAYSYIAISKAEQGFKISLCEGDNKTCGGDPKEIASVPVIANTVYFKISVEDNVVCRFYFSQDGKEYSHLGTEFKAKKGRWIGAKTGIFCINPNMEKSAGYSDFDWFRIK